VNEREQQLRATAVHEAGHAVASLILLGEPEGAAIFAEGDRVSGMASKGDLSAMPPMENYADEKLREVYAETQFRAAFDQAVVVESGHAAVRLWRGESWLPFHLSRGDRAMIEALARQCFGDPMPIAVLNHFAGLAYERALALLHPRMAGVESVALVLLARRRMSAAEVAATFAEGLRAPSNAVT